MVSHHADTPCHGAVDGDGMDEDEWDAYEEELDWAASAGLPPPPVGLHTLRLSKWYTNFSEARAHVLWNHLR